MINFNFPILFGSQDTIIVQETINLEYCSRFF